MTDKLAVLGLAALLLITLGLVWFEVVTMYKMYEHSQKTLCVRKVMLGDSKLRIYVPCEDMYEQNRRVE